MDKSMPLTITIKLERRDGYYHLSSPSVPGLHLGGPTLHDAVADLEVALSDLCRDNLKIEL